MEFTSVEERPAAFIFTVEEKTLQVAGSSITLIYLYQTTMHHITEEPKHHNHCSENLSHTLLELLQSIHTAKIGGNYQICFRATSETTSM